MRSNNGLDQEGGEKDAIFIVRQIQEMYLEKRKELFMIFNYWRMPLIECRGK